MLNVRNKFKKNWYIFIIIALLMLGTLANAVFSFGIFEGWDVHVAVFTNVIGFVIGRRLSGATWRETFSFEIPNEKG